jgi:hypothetical protein
MLALIEANTILGAFPEGGWFTLPDGSKASPATAGWSNGDCRLATIIQQEPPEGSRVGGWSRQLIDGVPTEVPELLPPLTDEEIASTMPVLERAQVLLALDSIGISEEMVDAMLAGNRQGMIEWKNRIRFRRDHYLIDALGALFNLPPAQIDSLWLWAAEL